MRIYTRTKKGSLSLSVNAIVVLVLAITMLGLGIAFTRNMFGDLQGRLLSNVDFANIPEPTHSNPISFENTRINLKSGERDIIGFKALNTLPSGDTGSLLVYSECGGDDDQLFPDIYDLLPTGTIDYLQEYVPLGEIVEYGLIYDTRGLHHDYDVINQCTLFFVFHEDGGSDEVETRVNLQVRIN